MPEPHLILASASPRRQELLEQIHLSFNVASQDIDESRFDEELAKDYVLRMATEKAQSALDALLKNEKTEEDSPAKSVILAADTIVLCDQQVLGKPSARNHAIQMLKTLSGREHRVLTAIAVASLGRIETDLSESSVEFREISTEEMALYWESGEPKGKAGGYAIQGRGAQFVKNLSGSYSGVMGLPLFETTQLLQAFGINCLQAKQDSRIE